jgi:hypothetical protein
MPYDPERLENVLLAAAADPPKPPLLPEIVACATPHGCCLALLGEGTRWL